MQAGELYVVFSVRDRPALDKTSCISVEKNDSCVSWKDSVLEIEIQDPTKAELLVGTFRKEVREEVEENVQFLICCCFQEDR